MSTIVVMPGGFHPFHAGHYALYKSAQKAFPDADVYVAATNVQTERPFPFEIKEKLAKVAGVEPGHFVQVKSPFRPIEITDKFDPEHDVLIFVRSEKDRNESPKPGGIKKDGTPAYFQPYTGKDLQPFSKHAYIAYLPTVKFGPGITSATEIRKVWPTLDDRRKTAMVMSLYPAAQKNPRLAKNIVQMMDIGMGSTDQLNEDVGGNYLYHGTSVNSAKEILASGNLRANTLAKQTASDAQTELPAVSFTRSLSYIKDPRSGGRQATESYPIVLVIDRNRLEQRYKTLGTSHSNDIRGLGFAANAVSNHKGKVNYQIKTADLNKDGKVSYDEIQQYAKALPDQAAAYFGTKWNKFDSSEFEEIVPVPVKTGAGSWSQTGILPIRNMIVGFWINPKTPAMQDEELMNHPLRLEMPRPNTFVRANKEPLPSRPTLTPAEKQAQKRIGQEKAKQMALSKNAIKEYAEKQFPNSYSKQRAFMTFVQESIQRVDYLDEK